MTRISCLTAAALLAAGCAAQFSAMAEAAGKTGQTVGASFQLGVGRSTAVVPNALKIGFDGVTADSRCGKGEVCVWEGDAVVRIWLQGPSGKKERRELHTAARSPGTTTFEGFMIRLLALNPVRISGHSIAPKSYVATLAVARGDTDDDPSH